MSEMRRMGRRYTGRSSRRTSLVLLIFAFGSFAALITLIKQAVQWNSSTCRHPPSAMNLVSPDVMFITLGDSRTITHSLKGLRKLSLGAQTCTIRIYTGSEYDFRVMSTKYGQTCAGLDHGCRVDFRYLHGLRMWGDINLEDVSKHTLAIFLRQGSSFTTRALDWVTLAHKSITEFYDKGGRRHYAGVAVGCHGKLALLPRWADDIAPLNTTCAFSPVRHGREDLWWFFTSWFSARRREWVSWPYIWNEESAVPTFWKRRSKHIRDKKLIEFGERTGKDHSYVNNPSLLWERWYPRWVANYTMRVLTADSSMGITVADTTQETGTEADSTYHRGMVSSGEVSTKHGDIVDTGTIWDEPLDGEFGDGYFSALRTIVKHRPEMVSLTIVSSKFVKLTRSWLCNVKIGGFLPPNVYWISLDRESKEALEETAVGRIVDITDALSADNMDSVNILYGQPAYWKLMLLRTRLIRDILDRGIDVFLFETDQVWLQNPFEFINREVDAGADMVGTLDTQHNVAGNTILLKSVTSTRRMWSEVYRRFKSSYDMEEIDSKEKHSFTFVQHDQHQLSALLLFDTEFNRDFPVALGLLNSQLFVGGSWYSGMYTTEESKRPIIINNNFLSGTEKKRLRAIVFDHWFLKDENICDVSAVRKALRYEFTKLPGKWWIKEQRQMERQVEG